MCTGPIPTFDDGSSWTVTHNSGTCNNRSVIHISAGCGSSGYEVGLYRTLEGEAEEQIFLNGISAGPMSGEEHAYDEVPDCGRGDVTYQWKILCSGVVQSTSDPVVVQQGGAGSIVSTALAMDENCRITAACRITNNNCGECAGTLKLYRRTGLAPSFDPSEIVFTSPTINSPYSNDDFTYSETLSDGTYFYAWRLVNADGGVDDESVAASINPECNVYVPTPVALTGEFQKQIMLVKVTGTPQNWTYTDMKILNDAEQRLEWFYHKNGGCGSFRFLTHEFLDSYFDDALAQSWEIHVRVKLVGEYYYTTWFRGVIRSIRQQEQGAEMFTDIRGYGYVEMLDNVQVQKQYNAGLTVKDVVDDIISTFVIPNTRIIRPYDLDPTNGDLGTDASSYVLQKPLHFECSALKAIKFLAELQGNREFGVDADKLFYFRESITTVRKNFFVGHDLIDRVAGGKTFGATNKVKVAGKSHGARDLLKVREDVTETAQNGVYETVHEVPWVTGEHDASRWADNIINKYKNTQDWSVFQWQNIDYRVDSQHPIGRIQVFGSDVSNDRQDFDVAKIQYIEGGFKAKPEVREIGRAVQQSDLDQPPLRAIFYVGQYPRDIVEELEIQLREQVEALKGRHKQYRYPNDVTNATEPGKIPGEIKHYSKDVTNHDITNNPAELQDITNPRGNLMAWIDGQWVKLSTRRTVHTLPARGKYIGEVVSLITDLTNSAFGVLRWWDGDSWEEFGTGTGTGGSPTPGVPVDITNANAQGSASTYALSDHMHRGIRTVKIKGEADIDGYVDVTTRGLLTAAQSGQTITFDVTLNPSLLQGGNVTGTGVSPRVAFWNGVNALTSDAGFTYDVGQGLLTVGSGISYAGDVVVNANGTGQLAQGDGTNPQSIILANTTYSGLSAEYLLIGFIGDNIAYIATADAGVGALGTKRNMIIESAANMKFKLEASSPDPQYIATLDSGAFWDDSARDIGKTGSRWGNAFFSGYANIGTTTDATAQGDFAAGLTGAGRIFWDQSVPKLYIYETAGIKNFYFTHDGTSARIGTSSGNLFFEGVDLLPSVTNTYDLGSATYQWRYAYFTNVQFNNNENVFNEAGANIDFRVEGDTDPFCLMVDASVDRVGIGTSGPDAKLDVLSTSTQLRLTYTDGSVYADLNTTSGGIFQINSTGNSTVVYGTAVGGNLLLDVQNNDNTNVGSHARLRALVGGSSAGDPYVHLVVNGAQDWAFGIDNSDSDKFKVSGSSGLGSNDYLTIATTGATTIAQWLNIGSATNAVSEGDLAAGLAARYMFFDASAATLAINGEAVQSNILLQTTASGTGASDGFALQMDGSNNAYLWNYEAGGMYFGTSGVERIHITSAGEIVFNETGIDADTRIESNNDANCFFVDGGVDRVGIGTSGPDAKLDILSTSTQLRLTHTDGSIYQEFRSTSTSFLWTLVSGSDVAAAWDMDFPSQTTQAVQVRYFRSNAMTTGTPYVQIFKGDGTANIIHQFAGQGDTSYVSNDAARKFGIGTDSPGVKVDILSATMAQLRLSYTLSSVYSEIQSTSAGVMSFSTTGTGGFVFNDSGIDQDFRVEADDESYCLMVEGTLNNLVFCANSEPGFNSMDGGIFLAEANVVPSGNPTSGVYLYVEGGVLKERDTAGNIKTMGEPVANKVLRYERFN